MSAAPPPCGGSITCCATNWQNTPSVARDGDFDEVRRLHRVLQLPYDEQPEHEADAGLPPDWAQHLEVSRSS